MKIKIVSNPTGYNVSIGEQYEALINKYTGQAILFDNNHIILDLDKPFYELVSETEPTQKSLQASLADMLGGEIKTLNVDFK